MSVPAQPKLKVAICGGGVGGLALAVALSRSPHVDVDVYEAARAFAELGAGVGLWPRAWRVVRALAPALAEELARLAGMGAPAGAQDGEDEDEEVLAFHFRKGDEPQGGTTFQRLATPGGLISLHRPDFQAALLRHLGPRVRTHTGKRLVAYAQASSSSGAASASSSSYAASSSSYVPAPSSGYAAAPGSSSYSESSSSHAAPDGSHGGGAVQLTFADGTHAACDVLVGADGVRSAVRAGMLAGPSARPGPSPRSGSGPSSRSSPSASSEPSAGSARPGARDDERRKADAVWSGTLSYRATVSADALRRRWPGHRVLAGPYIYLGRDGQLTVYPLAHGRINVAAFRARYAREGTPPGGPWVQDAPRAELLAAFGGWEGEVRALLECVETCSRWAVPMVIPLRTFVSGRVALLGDAAHAMMPYQGSGAGQAIEDAYLLATLLTHPRVLAAPHPHARAAGLARALAAYDAVRRPFAQAVAQRSRDAGVLYTLSHRALAPHPPAAAHPPCPLYPDPHPPHPPHTHRSDPSDHHHSGRRHHRGPGSAQQQPAEPDLLARTLDELAFAPGRDRAGDAARLQAVYARVVAAWAWAWETTADADVARAVRMLEGGEALWTEPNL